MATETLRPNGAGDDTELEPYDGTTNWQNVDEETPDGESTDNYNDTNNWLRDLYAIADHSVGSGTINHVKVYAHCKFFTSGTPENSQLKITIKSGEGAGAPDTISEGSEETLTTTWTNYSHQWDTNPKTGSAWTWDEIDNLQAGVSLRAGGGDAYSADVTQVYVEVEYTLEATPKSSSDTGSGADAYVSLEKPEAKTSSDIGSGVEGTPMPSAILAGSETGSGIEILVARLLATVDTGTSAEVSGLVKDLFVSELGLGSDSLVAKIEMPTKGGGMKLWI